jgi:hypothetical protein
MNSSQTFFTTLAQLHQTQATATILGLTAAERSIVVRFIAGEIIGLSHGDLTGTAALAQFEYLEISHCMVVSGRSDDVGQPNLPPTGEILLSLSLRIPLDVLALALQPTAIASSRVFVQAAVGSTHPTHFLRPISIQS